MAVFVFFPFLGAVQILRPLLPGFSPRQPTHPPGKKDGACHLLVCGEGEMTFEHPAKCECSLLSCATVRCDHCYFGCLSKEGVHMASPPLRVVKEETHHLASLCKSDYWHRNSRLCGGKALGDIKRGQKMQVLHLNQHDGVLWSVLHRSLGMWSAHSTTKFTDFNFRNLQTEVAMLFTHFCVDALILNQDKMNKFMSEHKRDS